MTIVTNAELCKLILEECRFHLREHLIPTTIVDIVDLFNSRDIYFYNTKNAKTPTQLTRHAVKKRIDFMVEKGYFMPPFIKNKKTKFAQCRPTKKKFKDSDFE